MPPSGGAADYAGITYERIAREDGVFWPCPDEGHPGTPRLFLDRFGTETGAPASMRSSTGRRPKFPTRTIRIS